MNSNKTIYRRYTKRMLDFILSLVAILILSPLLLILTVLGWINMKGNPFFLQDRPGKDGKVFKLIKFRSMTNEKDSSGKLLSDDERLHYYGRKLRSTSLDELPELINILIGDMSIVGPRPLLVEYLPFYSEEEMHRHDVLPGLTGWAQVNGRNSTPWDERLQQDLFYVENLSFALDVRIFFMTIGKVIKKSDILIGKEIPAGRLDDARKKVDYKLVNVRKFAEEDIPNKVKWINDLDNNAYLHYDLPLSEEKTKKWFNNIKNRQDRYDAVIEYDGKPVGIVGLLKIDSESAEFYITMGETQYKGKGIAKEACNLVLDYGFEKLGLNEIYLYTEVDNIIAQKLFEKCGFILRFKEENSAVNRGKMVDRYYYSIRKEEGAR